MLTHAECSDDHRPAVGVGIECCVTGGPAVGEGVGVGERLGPEAGVGLIEGKGEGPGVCFTLSPSTSLRRPAIASVLLCSTA